MSKEEKPILNLQKGCPFCGNMNLVAEAILSKLKDIKSYVARLTGFVAELAGYSIED